VYETFSRVLQRFDALRAPANEFIFGFVPQDDAPLSVIFSTKGASLVPHVRDAEYLVYGTSDAILKLIDPDAPDRTAVVAQLRMRPDYPFNNYLLSIFLNTFDLAIPDLDYIAKRFDGPYPFPPRYPVSENVFRSQVYEPTPLPPYDPLCLPEVVADDHPLWVGMNNKAWMLAFKNLRQPTPESGFVANFIDPAFNANTFMWDSCFMTMFGRYAREQFRFIGTLDNFYAKQYDDGFICREINTYSGASVFQPLDPRSTGPNILAWTEWIDYEAGKDRERLERIFPVLIGYHRWWKEWRTHPDGGYWTSGWGSGMDNQTRVPRSEYHHRHYTWIDAMMQQALSCITLLQMAHEIRRREFDDELRTEYEHLQIIINTRMWDEKSGFYYDLAPDGTLSTTKSIGAYWGLLSPVIPEGRAVRMIAHLNDPAVFKRPHPIPTQAYDSEVYNPYGGYWVGGVWSPTNYMVLQGLTQRGYHDLAHQIAHAHIEQIAAVFAETGTLWENYAPEHPKPGRPAGKDFVGWTGVSAINILLEYVIGLRHAENRVVWDIRLSGRHGVRRYPVLSKQGSAHTADLIYEGDRVTVQTTTPLILEIHRASQVSVHVISAGEHCISL
jgi:hypothetical protein